MDLSFGSGRVLTKKKRKERNVKVIHEPACLLLNHKFYFGFFFPLGVSSRIQTVLI